MLCFLLLLLLSCHPEPAAVNAVCALSQSRPQGVNSAMLLCRQEEREGEGKEKGDPAGARKESEGISRVTCAFPQRQQV